MNTKMKACITLAGIAAIVMPAFLFAQSAPSRGAAPSAGTATKPADTLIKKVPVPTADQLKVATKLIDDIFKADLAAARTPELRKFLLEKMEQSAAGEKDPAARYAVLNRARELAIDYAFVDVAFGLADKIENWFEVDAVTLLADTVAALQRTTNSPNDLRTISTYALTCTDRANEVDRFDVSKQMLDLAAINARNLPDANLLRDVVAKLTRMRELEVAFAEPKKALAALAANPSDPDANLKVGKHYCFTKGNWAKGLPLLIQGNDDALKAAAKADVQGAANTDAQMKIGDAWWDLGDKATGVAQIRLHMRAATWYETALPKLEGIAKTKGERRITQAEIERWKLDNRGLIDLIGMTKIERDTIGGKWKFEERTLISPIDKPATYQFPYRPPMEYDYRVEFTRTEGDDAFVLIMSTGKRNFAWQIGGWHNTVIGFENVDEKRANVNVTSSQGGIENGKKIEAIVKVRKGSIEGYLNGKLISSLRTNFSNISDSDYFQIKDKAAVGIATWASSFTITKVEIIEISGRGTATGFK